MTTETSNPKHALLKGIKEAFGEDAIAVLPKDAQLPDDTPDISISGGKYSCVTEKPRVKNPGEYLGYYDRVWPPEIPKPYYNHAIVVHRVAHMYSNISRLLKNIMQCEIAC